MAPSRSERPIRALHRLRVLLKVTHETVPIAVWARVVPDLRKGMSAASNLHSCFSLGDQLEKKSVPVVVNCFYVFGVFFRKVGNFSVWWRKLKISSVLGSHF